MSDKPATDNPLEWLGDLDPHDPDRTETRDGLDDPDVSNGTRAEWAEQALEVFREAARMGDEDAETVDADLVCDLLHLVHSLDGDPAKVLERGVMAFGMEGGAIADVMASADTQTPTTDGTP